MVCRSLNESNDQALTNLIGAAVEKTNAEFVVLAQDQTGKGVGPRISAKLNAGHISGAIDLPETSNGFVVKTNVYSGKAIAHVALHSAKKVISILLDIFEICLKLLSSELDLKKFNNKTKDLPLVI